MAKNSTLFFLVVILFMILPCLSAVNLILNGGFENNIAGTQLPQYWGFTGGTPANSYVRNDSYGINGNYYYLNDVPGPQPTLYQDVTIQSGELLRLTGNYRTMVIGTYSNSFAIRFTNLLNSAVLETITYNPTGNSWGSFDISRQFATTSLRVSFISQYGTDDDYAIDNIVLLSNASTVPEPSLLISFLAGICFLAFFVRKSWK